MWWAPLVTAAADYAAKSNQADAQIMSAITPSYGPTEFGPSLAGGGVWTVATGGSRADNTGSAAAGVGASPDTLGDMVARFMPLALVLVGGIVFVKVLK